LARIFSPSAKPPSPHITVVDLIVIELLKTDHGVLTSQTKLFRVGKGKVFFKRYCFAMRRKEMEV
jgi:hypothetical protein